MKSCMDIPMPIGLETVTRGGRTGYVFILSDGAVTWCSKRQASVALSTVESEYMALSLATQEAVWLRRLVEEKPGSGSNRDLRGQSGS